MSEGIQSKWAKQRGRNGVEVVLREEIEAVIEDLTLRISDMAHPAVDPLTTWAGRQSAAVVRCRVRWRKENIEKEYGNLPDGEV